MKCPWCLGTGTSPDWLAVGQKWRALRVKRGLKLREVARRVGISPAYLSDLERGRRGWNGPGAKAVEAAITRAK